jgi:hypothetical protein
MAYFVENYLWHMSTSAPDKKIFMEFKKYKIEYTYLYEHSEGMIDIS